MLQLEAEQIVQLFNARFKVEYNTILIAGADEPLYLPASCSDESFSHRSMIQGGASVCKLHRIFFTKDYVRSALHEIAHWVIAGSERRLQLDYGYWYRPDGRNELQQKEFERVEILPQAIEWLFCEACQIPFSPSLDNLKAPSDSNDEHHFLQRIIDRKTQIQKENVPDRAQLFIDAITTMMKTLKNKNIGRCANELEKLHA